jgi:hypothetical protein
MYYANGGFNWYDLYHMPTKLREFYYNELVKAKTTETDAIEKGRNKNKTSKTNRR